MTGAAALETTANAVYGVLAAPSAQSKSGNVNEVVSYLLTVENNGNITDTFDVSIASIWPANPAWSSLEVGIGESASLSVSVNIPANAVAGAPNTTTVTFVSQGDGSKTSQATLATTANAVYGLSAAATADQTVNAGETAAYTVAITNTGNITDIFDIVVSGGWPFTASAAAIQIGPGAQGSIEVSVAVPANAAPGSSKNTSIVFISQGDATKMVNVAVTTSVAQPQATDADVSVIASLSVSKPTVGQQFAYLIEVSNAGPADATNTVLTVQLPSTVSFVSASLAGCSEAGGVVTCQLGDLASGSSRNIGIYVSAVSGGTFAATISVSADQNDPSVGNGTIVVETETAFVVYLPSMFKGSN